MSDARRFHLPLSHLRRKSSSKALTSPTGQDNSSTASPDSATSQHQDTAATTDALGKAATDVTSPSPKSSDVLPHQASAADIRKAIAALATNMAAPSKNNFAQSNDDTNFASRHSHDIVTPSPIIEYDLGEGFFSTGTAAEQSMSNSHRRNKSSESSYSSRWWKLARMRHHNKSASASTHPTIDTGRAISSRSSSFASIHGTDGDARSSTTSFMNQRYWLDKQSPTASPQLDNFMFPKPQIPQYSQSSLELRQAYSRDGHRKPEGLSSLHSTQSSLSSASHARQKSSQSLDSLTKFTLPAQDKWSMQLGHANYTIYPEPYPLHSFDLSSWQTLLDDYDAAQAEYCKHKARTIEHYGLNSETFKLTELKWADITSTWDHSINSAKKHLISRGIHPSQVATNTASHSVRMPALNPHVDGKFPKLGDEDIIGPMAQSEPLVSREPSPVRKGSSHKWNKLFSGSRSGSTHS